MSDEKKGATKAPFFYWTHATIRIAKLLQSFSLENLLCRALSTPPSAQRSFNSLCSALSLFSVSHSSQLSLNPPKSLQPPQSPNPQSPNPQSPNPQSPNPHFHVNTTRNIFQTSSKSHPMSFPVDYPKAPKLSKNSSPSVSKPFSASMEQNRT